MHEFRVLCIFNLQCNALERVHIAVDGLGLPQHLQTITGIVLLIYYCKLRFNGLLECSIGVRHGVRGPSTCKPIPLQCISTQQ